MKYNYCINCMKPLGDTPVCRRCGWDNSQPPQAEPYHLPPGTLLAGRYLVGKVLGEGGFGITYIGLHTTLSKRLAIKEFYPSGAANRTSQVSEEVHITKDKQEFFHKGVERFLLEAKNVAAFPDEDGIVDVIDYFQENNTAYIVMEYLEGLTLKDYTKKHGLFFADQLIALMLPLMRSLSVIHSHGIIHRDISPDNIMYTKSGRLKLMDFGSARYFTNEDRQMSVILKQGFAPEEQYRSSGNQGPHTDVYSLCATIYACITGRVPVNSLERMAEDTLRTPSQLGVPIRPQHEQALMHGLAVRVQDRTPDMETLVREMNAAPVPNVTVHTEAPFGAPPTPPYQNTTSHTNPWQPTGPYTTSGYTGAAPSPVTGTGNAPVKKKSQLPLVLGITIPAVVVTAAIVILAVVLAGKGGNELPPEPQTSETERVSQTQNVSGYISDLISGASGTESSQAQSSAQSSKAQSSAAQSSAGTSSSRVITEQTAPQYNKELTAMMLELLPEKDAAARAGEKLSIAELYYVFTTDSDYERLLCIHHNETAGYYCVSQISPENISESGGRLHYDSNYVSFDETQKTLNAAKEKNFILSSTTGRYRLTPITPDASTAGSQNTGVLSAGSTVKEESTVETYANEKGMSEAEAKKNAKALSEMMTDTIRKRDHTAKENDKIEIKNIYYIRSKTNTSYRRLVYVYYNATQKYYRAVQISPEYVTVANGKAEYSLTYLSYDDSASTLEQAAQNNWYLSNQYKKDYNITTVM